MIYEGPKAGQGLILDLCGGTGAWSKPYRDAGYEVEVVSPGGFCTRPTKMVSEDVRLFPSGTHDLPRLPRDFADISHYLHNVRGILCAPVCTYLSGSGARWPRTDDEMREALSLVDACLRIVWVLKPAWWCMENPVGKLVKWIGPPVASFNPCDYGDPYTKKTLLWGNFRMPEKTPVEPVKACSQGSYLQKLGGKSAKTKEIRSRTPEGFARAFFEANP